MPGLLLINNYNYRRGGAEVVYLEQARMFREMGWRVSQLSMHHPQNEPSQFDDYFTESIEFGDSASLGVKLRQAVKIIYSREAEKKVRALIEKEKPDIVHAHNVYHHLSPSVLKASKDCGLPVVMTTHDLKLLCPAYSMRLHGQVCEDCRHFGRKALLRNRCMKDSLALSSLIYVESTLHSVSGIYKKNLDALVSPSRFMIGKFNEWGWDGPPLYHVPNFADIQEIRPQFSPGRHFVYFGRLSPEKGLHTLVTAAAKANVPLKLIGSGPMEVELRQLAEELHAEVSFPGFMNGAQLWQAVGESRAVVLASECYENAPLTILEAYACGKPAIGANIGGISELIVQGRTGELFPSGNSDMLADALRQYANYTDAEIEAQGREAHALVSARYTRSAHIAGLTNVYEQVLGRPLK